MRWTPEELAADAAGRLLQRGSRWIAGVFIDTRAPLTNGLFVPIVAARDGHDYIPQAVAGGAAAVLQEAGRPVPVGDISVVEVADTLEAFARLARTARDRFAGPVVAITGSNGKTTTRAMISAVLARRFGKVIETRGNLNNHLGVPLTILNEPHEADAMVVELGMSAPGENDHLAGIVRPTVGVVTSVALEHLEFLGTIEAIADAESEIMPHVQAGGALVIPGDEPLLRSRVPADYPVRVLKFGPDADCDVMIVSIEVGLQTRATLRLRGRETIEVGLQPFGAHNARNAAAAAATGIHLGLEPRSIVEALETVAPIGDRGRILSTGEHLVIADCYNANPGSVTAALRSLAALRGTCDGQLVAVLGDMLELGPTELELHAEIGVLAADLGLDLIIGFGPRSLHTVQEVRSRGKQAVHVGEDVVVAGDEVRARLARDGRGAVLIKASRGMRLERLVALLVGDPVAHGSR